MSLNDPPVIRWYAATLIYRCTVNGQDGSPSSGANGSIPLVHREVMLLQSHGPDAACDLAIERARYRLREKPGGTIEGVGIVEWEFAGLEDVEELPVRDSLDGAIVWGRPVMGLPASKLVYPKEQLSVFDSWARGWSIGIADNHKTRS